MRYKKQGYQSGLLSWSECILKRYNLPVLSPRKRLFGVIAFKENINETGW